MMRLVSRRLTKIINIPNMKDHGATGVTGCLKNIAYGSFSNVARTHQRGKSYTYSVVPKLASIEPLRSQNRAADHGRPARRLARRPVRADDALRLLPAGDSYSAPIRWRSIACSSTSSTTSARPKA